MGGISVIKSDKTVRICRDYKITINKGTAKDTYPILKIEDLHTQLSGDEGFTSLDMRHAYEQIELEEESHWYVTINTHQGLFMYDRLPYGVSSVPAIFQRVMDSLLQSVPNTLVYLDDILVTGKNEAEHLKNVETLLEKMNTQGGRYRFAPSRSCTDSNTEDPTTTDTDRISKLFGPD